MAGAGPNFDALNEVINTMRNEKQAEHIEVMRSLDDIRGSLDEVRRLLNELSSLSSAREKNLYARLENSHVHQGNFMLSVMYSVSLRLDLVQDLNQPIRGFPTYAATIEGFHRNICIRILESLAAPFQHDTSTVVLRRDLNKAVGIIRSVV